MAATMFGYIGLLISFLALLNVAHCATVINTDSTEWKCKQVPYGSEVHYGFGEGYQPYYIIKDDNLTLFSSSDVRCDLNSELITGALGRSLLTSQIYQVSRSMLYFVDDWCDSKKILAVDMNACTAFDLLKKISGSSEGERWQWCENLIHFDDGFDEIIVDKSNSRVRVSYDLRGNRIGEPRPFALDPRDNLFRPFSTRSRASNLLASRKEPADDFMGKRLVSVVSADGKLIKDLLEYPASHASYFPHVRKIGESSYAYCDRSFGESEGVSGLGFECGQFDEFGRESFRNLTECKHYYDSQVGLFNLKNGAGVVLFTFDSRNDPEISAIEIRADGEVRKMSYPRAKGSYDYFYVTDFDEADRRFTIRAGSDEETCWNTFALPSSAVGDSPVEKTFL